MHHVPSISIENEALLTFLSMSEVSRWAFLWDLGVSLFKLAVGRLLPILKIPTEDLSGKTAIVTGSNSGIGLQIALDLARQNATVYLACRDQTKAMYAAKQITSAIPTATDRVHTLSLDTSSLSSVRDCAKAWKSHGLNIDILFHNAGVGDAMGQQFTEEGFPQIYETNFLGSFLLTYFLEQHLSDNGRVIFTTSTGQYSGGFVKDFSLTSIKNQLEKGYHYPPSEKKSKVMPSMEYSNSKAMQCAFTKLLTQRWIHKAEQSGKPCKLITHSFSPGFTSTPIFAKSGVKSFLSDPIFWLLRATYTVAATSVQQGALTGVWLATTSNIDVVGDRKGGAYWDRMTRRIPQTDLLSQKVLDRMWIRWEADAGIEWR